MGAVQENQTTSVFNRGIRKNDLKLKLLFASKMQHPAELQNHYLL